MCCLLGGYKGFEETYASIFKARDKNTCSCERHCPSYPKRPKHESPSTPLKNLTSHMTYVNITVFLK